MESLIWQAHQRMHMDHSGLLDFKFQWPLCFEPLSSLCHSAWCVILSQETKSCTMKQSASVTKTEPICTDTNCALTDERKRQITMQDQVEKGSKLKEFHPWDAYHCYCHHQHHTLKLGFLFQHIFSTNSDAMPIAVMLVFLVTCTCKKILNSKII